MTKSTFYAMVVVVCLLSLGRGAVYKRDDCRARCRDVYNTCLAEKGCTNLQPEGASQYFCVQDCWLEESVCRNGCAIPRYPNTD